MKPTMSCDTEMFGLCGPLQFLSLYKPEGNHNVGWEHHITVSHAKQLQTASRRTLIYYCAVLWKTDLLKQYRAADVGSSCGMDN